MYGKVVISHEKAGGHVSFTERDKIKITKITNRKLVIAYSVTLSVSPNTVICLQPIIYVHIYYGGSTVLPLPLFVVAGLGFWYIF